MMSTWKAFALIVLLVMVWAPTSSGQVTYPGSDTQFKMFLNGVYKRIQLNVQAKVQVTKDVYTSIAKIMAKVASYDPCYDFRVQLKGSTYDLLKISQPDEFDFGLVNDRWTGKIALLVNGNTPPGLGYATQIITTCLDKFKIAGTNHLDASKVRGHLRELVERAMLDLGMKGKVVKSPWMGGPAVTFEFVAVDQNFLYISIDLAIAIDLTHWPPGARARPASIMNAKVQLVPKVKPFLNPAFWQISFAEVEKRILENIDNDGGCRKKVLQLAKHFMGKSVAKWYPLASYHLKVILLHMNDEKKRSEDWAQGMLVPRFKEFIERLLAYLRSGSLPCFFMPGVNQFAVNIRPYLPSAISSVNNFLKTLRENPQALV